MYVDLYTHDGSPSLLCLTQSSIFALTLPAERVNQHTVSPSCCRFTVCFLCAFDRLACLYWLQYTDRLAAKVRGGASTSLGRP